MHPAAHAVWGCQSCKFWQFTPGFKPEVYRGAVLDKVDHVCASWGVKHRGNKNPDILFVGEAPGFEEDRRGKAFVGASGRLLDSIIETLHLKRNYKIAFHNVIMCWPWMEGGGGQKNPTLPEAKLCSGFLGGYIAKKDPMLIVPLGGVALQALVGEKISILSAQGHARIHPIAGKDRWIFPVPHPAYILRQDHLIEEYLELFEKMSKIADSVRSTGSAGTRKKTKVEVITDMDRAVEVLTTMQKQGREKGKCVAFDIEGKVGYTRLNGRSSVTPTAPGSVISHFGVSNKEGTGVSIILNHIDIKPHPRRKLQAVIAAITNLIEDPKVPKVAQHKKFDLQALKRLWGINNADPFISDTMIEHHLLEGVGPHNLDHLSYRYTDMGGYKKKVKDAETEFNYDYTRIPLDVSAPYNARDCDATLRIHNRLTADLKDDQKLARINKLYSPLVSNLLGEMESNGITIDTEIGEILRLKFMYWESVLYNRMVNVKGVKRFIRAHKREKGEDEEFNPRSTPQLRRILFEFLKHKSIKKTKKSKEDSTDKEVLIFMAANRDCVFSKAMLDYRTWNRLRTTYAEAFIHDAEHCEGKLHGSYSQTTTKTYRLASSNPNLQNLPNRGAGDVKRMIVSSFRSPHMFIELIERVLNDPWETWYYEVGCLLSFDFSQIELRILACLSQDPLMLEIYRHGGDIHKETCCSVFGMTPEEYDVLKKSDEFESAMRRTIAKRVNFGAVFQIGGGGLQGILAREWPPIYRADYECTEYLNAFFRKFGNVRKWIDRSNRSIVKHAMARNVMGFVRHLPEVNNSDEGQVRAAEREGTNFRVQSPAAALMMIAALLIRSDAHRKKLRSKPILSVHDSIVFDCPLSEIVQLQRIYYKYAENIPKYAHRVWGPGYDWSWLKQIPLKIDVDLGPNYRDHETPKKWTPKSIAMAYRRAIKKSLVRDAEAESFAMKAVNLSL